jgi:hypothetical protein
MTVSTRKWRYRVARAIELLPERGDHHRKFGVVKL